MVGPHQLLFQKLHHRGIFNLPAPCCYPRSSAPLTMLYIDGLDENDEPNFVESVFPEMITTSCSCG